MSSVIGLKGVSLDYPVYSFKSQSLRYAIANLSIGGKLMENHNKTVVVRALNNISFDLQSGDRLALIGPNGSGKSSLLRLLAGVYEPTGGNLSITGRISSMLDLSQGLDLEATGIENIKLLAAMRGLSPWRIKDKTDSIVEFSELGAFASMPVRVYSSGMVARLLFSVATAFDHDILLIEEWLTAGDADFVHKATERMKSLVDNARVIVTATHSEPLVRAVANKIMRLEHGAITFFGTTEEYFERFDFAGEYN